MLTTSKAGTRFHREGNLKMKRTHFKPSSGEGRHLKKQPCHPVKPVDLRQQTSSIYKGGNSFLAIQCASKCKVGILTEHGPREGSLLFSLKRTTLNSGTRSTETTCGWDHGQADVSISPGISFLNLQLRLQQMNPKRLVTKLGI